MYITYFPYSLIHPWILELLLHFGDYKQCCHGNSLAVQWLGLHAFTAVGLGSIAGWRTKILQAIQHSQKNPQTQKTQTKQIMLP